MTAPYIIASWDYTSEGREELSFKEDNQIKLPKKHNDDWWEGQSLGYGLRTAPENDLVKGGLGGTVGFLPTNQTRPEADLEALVQSTRSASVSALHTNAASAFASQEGQPPTSYTSLDHNARPRLPPPPPPHDPAAEKNGGILADVSTNSITGEIPKKEAIDDIANLAKGWMAAYDSQNSLSHDPLFSEKTQCPEGVDTLSVSLTDMTLVKNDKEEEEQEEVFDLSTASLNNLELDRIKPRLIREQGFLQIKMVTDNVDCGSYTKNKKLVRPVIPVGSLDLLDCQVNPANKLDTRRKHTFIVTIRDNVKLLVQAEDNKGYSCWLDAIMRDILARREAEKDHVLELLQHLAPELSRLNVNQMVAYCAETLQAIELGEKDAKRKSRLRHLWALKPASEVPFAPTSGRVSESTFMPSTDQAATSAKTIIEKGNPVFGGFLQMEEDGSIPLVVRLCVEEVEKRGLNIVGIYRLSGPAKSIEYYRALLNQGDKHVSFADEPDINTVTGLLKRFFRELRDPLLMHEHFDEFMKAARITDYDERMYTLREIVRSLPPANYNVLEYLTHHLRRVSKNREVNKMEATNLALIFSVGLLRPEHDDMGNIIHTNLQTRVVEALIQLVDWFFEKDDGPESDFSSEEEE